MPYVSDLSLFVPCLGQLFFHYKKKHSVSEPDGPFTEVTPYLDNGIFFPRLLVLMSLSELPFTLFKLFLKIDSTWMLYLF